MPTWQCDRKFKMTRLLGKKPDQLALETLYFAAESQVAFAQLFVTVAQEAYKTGERELGDHARSVANCACSVIVEILREIDPAAELTLRADLHGICKSLENL